MELHIEGEEMNKTDYDIKMELWRREADPKCDFCLGRGHITRIVGEKKTGFKRMIDCCGCRKKKDKGSFVEKVNAGDITMGVGGGND